MDDTQNKNEGGRPSDYSIELAEEICSRIAEGLSIRTICQSDDMPSKSTFFKWLRLHKEFRDLYQYAKIEQAEALIEETLDIADDGSNDWMEIRKKNGDIEIVLDKEHISRSKLRVETREWIAMKLLPKKYGMNPVGVQMMDKNGNPADPVGGAVIDVLAAALENVKQGKERGEKVERELENQRTSPL